MMIKSKHTIISFMLFSFVLLFAASDAWSKDLKPYTFEDAMKFKTIRYGTLSADGLWFGYSLVPDRGDGRVVFRSTQDTTEYSFPRGTQAKISKNSEWAVFTVLPTAVELENSKTAKDKPKSTFSILNLKNGKTVERPNVSKFEFSNDGVWLAYQYSEPYAEKDKKLKDKKLGTNLNLRHLPSGTDIRIDAVGEFEFDSLSTQFFYTVSTNDGAGDGLFVRKLKEAFAPEQSIKSFDKSMTANLDWTETGKRLAFQFSTLDETGKGKKFAIYSWADAGDASIATLIDSVNLPADHYIPQTNSLKWTADGKRLFFGIKPNADRYDDDNEKGKYTDSTFFNLDTIADKADLHLWHWNDPLIMTNQINRWNVDKDKYFTTLYDTEKRSLVQLGDSSLPDVFLCDNDLFTVASTDAPYMKEKTWYGDIYDVYSVNLRTGKRTLIESKVEERSYVSPDGKRIVYYKNKNWYAFDNATGKRSLLTDKIPSAFYDVEFDMPATVPSYGFGAWMDNGSKALIYDRYDIWMFSFDGAAPICLTNGAGALASVSFRIKTLDRKKEYYTSSDTLLMEGYDNRMKVQGIYSLALNSAGSPSVLQTGQKKFYLLGKAEFGESYLFTRESYEEYPDVWLSNNNSLTKAKKLTEANPEIKDYEWGSTELVRWVNAAGDSLDGYIIKPANYNPKKRYPVYVYFYERFSDRTYNFSTPMINHRPIPQVYNSGGYLMFLPDIKYHDGVPGPSALDAIMTGSKMLIDRGIADKDKFCIQGHSWSAYQTAYIVTQTDFFKAACAGAPVSNMTSAYGQIRLESGLTRQFQYEAQQSRIGGTLWDSLDNYLLNSPLFHINKTNTPMLMMFGDIDEAVPWQQGIELYMSYRRLSKNIVFLQYENEPHHPRKYQNKLDYAQKMKEFFDHYVLGTPAKDWILNGKPYKGK